MIAPYDAWLTTLDELKQHRNVKESNLPTNGDYTMAEVDALLTLMIQQASGDIVTYLQRLPVPHVRTRRYDVPYGEGLYLDGDLLSATTVSDGVGTITSSDYLLMPYDDYPKSALALNSLTYTYWRPPSSGLTRAAVTVAGVWGYVPHWSAAWLDSGQDVPVGGLTSSATSVTLASIAGFEVGHYLRIEDEYLQVTAYDTDTLTLSRGVLGTAAAAHDAGEAIEIFRQMDVIRTNTTEWAAYLFKTLDDLGGEVQVYEGGVQFNKGLSPLIKMALRSHRNLGGGRL